MTFTPSGLTFNTVFQNAAPQLVGFRFKPIWSNISKDYVAAWQFPTPCKQTWMKVKVTQFDGQLKLAETVPKKIKKVEPSFLTESRRHIQ